MKKYLVNAPAGVASSGQLTIIKRNINVTKGILLNSTHTEIANWSGRTFLPNVFNDPTLYIRNRKVDILPESTIDNTIITNDGLVAVVYSVSGVFYVSILDLIESENTAYADIAPVDYEAFNYYNELINPTNKRSFICYGTDLNAGVYTLQTKNRKIYEAAGYTYFESSMDYPIERPINASEYGYYKVLNADWTSTYSETTNFQFFKKQFFRILGPVDLTVSLQPEDSTITLQALGNGFYRLKDLDIDLSEGPDFDDVFINFKLTTAEAYCSIIVY